MINAHSSYGRIAKRYRLKGPYAGFDTCIAGVLFKAGEAQVVATESEHVTLARVFWFYQAEEVTDDGKRDAETNRSGEVVGDARPGGEGSAAGVPNDGDRAGHGAGEAVAQAGGLVPQGDGPQASLDERIRAAVASLDPSADSHWTAAGKPSLQVVSDSLGITVTRAQVSAAAPGAARKGAA